MNHLSMRMRALADMVTPGHVLCDVGCDHGFLPIYLIQKGVIPAAIAMDVAEGPLQSARGHIAECGLEEKIQTRISDGLEHLAEGEADTILIAGMGGRLVIHILSMQPDVAKAAKELILQPQSELYEVRRYLYGEGYEVLDEDIVFEDGKYYPMMKVRYAGCKQAARQTPKDEEFYFGKRLLESRHPVLLEFLKREQKKYLAVLKTLQAGNRTEAIGVRIEEVSAYLQMIEEIGI